jgi:type I restriction enzyme R subunit
VVDRKDLDRQTREEFNKFQEGSVEENTNTETLVRRMLSTDYANKVIVTTIQKLGLALDPNKKTNLKERLEPLSKNESFSFLTSATVRSLEKIIKPLKSFFRNAQYLDLLEHPFLMKTQPTSKRRKVGSYKTTKIFSKRITFIHHHSCNR